MPSSLRLAPISKLADLGRAGAPPGQDPVRVPGGRGPDRTRIPIVSGSGQRAGRLPDPLDCLSPLTITATARLTITNDPP